MINKKVEKLMNEQIVNELYSAYLYLAMSAYFESINMKGAANWMRCQAQEEQVHAMKFYTHIVERAGRVKLGGINKPDGDWASPLAVFEAAYKHEQKVTALINDIVTTAEAEKDYASRSLLQWFVDEQIEEESSADEVVQQLKLLKEDKGPGVLLLDKELGARIFTYPTNVNAPAD